MVSIISVNIRNREAFNRINNKILKLPKEISEGGFEFCKLYQRNLRLQLTLNKTIWRHQLWESIKARQKSKFQSEVVMANYGVFLDRMKNHLGMKGHWVKLKRGRLIRLWALQKGNQRVKEAAKREASIIVSAHPFIDSSFERTVIKLMPILQRRMNKAIGD